MNEYKGNAIIATIGVVIGFISGKLFKYELLPATTLGKAGLTFVSIFASTIIGKEIMYFMISEKIGYDKVLNEGFIGPYNKFDFIGPHGSNQK